MKKKVIGDCTLYCGDALEILPTLPKSDLLVSDPPYELTSGGNTTGEMSGKFDKSKYDNSGKIVKCDIDWQDFMPLFYDCLQERAHAYVMCNNRHVQNMLNSAEQASFKFHNLLVWNKGTVTPNRWYMKNLEFTGFFYKGKAKYINNCGDTQLHEIPNPRGEAHPTAKPVPLMKKYIYNSSDKGQTVIDPFMGGGSVGVACAEMGRKFIGIELDEEYFDIACKRIEDAYRQGDLFL